MTLYLSCFLHIGDNSKSALSQDEDDLLAEDVLENLIADVEQLPFEKAKVVPAEGETESRET